MVAEIGIAPGSPSWLRLARRAKVLAVLSSGDRCRAGAVRTHSRSNAL
jgi:hypothetical protein